MRNIDGTLPMVWLAATLAASLGANILQRSEYIELQKSEVISAEMLKDTYEAGFKAGIAAAAKKAAASLPQQCTTWWFGNDKATIKLRHQQAKAAYCPGKKSAT